MELVKVLREHEIHNGFAYETGENVDVFPFDTTTPCSRGGLYHCLAKDALVFSKLWPDAKWVTRIFTYK